jgi:hypothetical protein
VEHLNRLIASKQLSKFQSEMLARHLKSIQFYHDAIMKELDKQEEINKD